MPEPLASLNGMIMRAISTRHVTTTCRKRGKGRAQRELRATDDLGRRGDAGAEAVDVLEGRLREALAGAA